MRVVCMRVVCVGVCMRVLTRFLEVEVLDGVPVDVLGHTRVLPEHVLVPRLDVDLQQKQTTRSHPPALIFMHFAIFLVTFPGWNQP